MAAKAQKEDVKFEDKQKALDAALSQIEKQFGKGAVMKLGDNNAKMAVEVVPTGSLSLDLALGLAVCRRAESSRFMALNPPVRQRLPCTWWQRCRSAAALQGMWMRSMRWTPPMQRRWG